MVHFVCLHCIIILYFKFLMFRMNVASSLSKVDWTKKNAKQVTQ